MTHAAPATSWWRDAIERVVWTMLQVGAATAAVEVTGRPEWWIAPLTILLTVVKVTAAKRVGNPSSAAIGGNS